MIVVQVQVRAKADNVERLEQALREVVTDARRERGCSCYDWYRSPDVAGVVFVYAEFESDDAFAEYRKGPVVKRIREQVLPLLEARPSFKHFSAVILEQG